MKRKLQPSGRLALTSVAFAALCLATPLANALGLGRLNVQSALGEALKAEIEVTSMTAEEQANLRIRVAPPESYRAANVDYNQVLPSTRATLEKRADGRLYVRLVSDRGVQEPFVDVILEISWATGRLVREYTLLFDPPPSITARAQPGSATTAPVASSTPPSTLPIAPAPSPRQSRAEAREAARVEARERREAARAAATAARSEGATARPAPSSAAPTATAGSEAGADEYRVRPGDTLSKIAKSTQRQGVSLDQMLVSLFRSNPEAFMSSNMNRLRSGVVLNVPSAEAAQGVAPGEARQAIIAQSHDFGAYRQRLASSTLTPRAETSPRTSSGRVTASVDERRPGVPATPDRLVLSKGASGVAAANTPEARLSAERERQASAARMAELDRNMADLRRVQGAASQPPGVTTPSTAARPASAVLPPPVVVAAASQARPSIVPPLGASVPLPTVVPGTSVPAVASSASIGVPPIAAVSASAGSAVVVAAASAASMAPAIVRPPASAVRTTTRAKPEPGLMDQVVDNAPYIAGGVALLALLGFAAYRWNQRSKKQSGETSFLESRLQPDSFFGASGGQRIDTRDAGGSSSSMTYSLSQLDAIGDVDPVAEADVYLAYGRDLQAEEILKEAMRSNPERLAIRTKLLEVYAKRRDIKGFELLATQLFALTRGEGEDWAKAQELGRSIDVENPLYQAGGAPTRGPDTTSGRPEPLGASTLPQSVLPVPSQFGDSSIDSRPVDSQFAAVDLDLDNPEIGEPSGAMPLDITASIPPRPAQSPTFQQTTLKMPLSAGEAPGAADKRDEPLPFDLSGISLDLDKPGSTTSGTLDPIELPFIEADDGTQDPLARKLELAEEFQRIGDKDGARDLLREVLATATGSTKTKAQAMLSDLG